MGFRFRKSISIIPGVRINFGLWGMSATIGPRGASLNVGPRGTYANVGIPGTGLSSRTRLDSGTANEHARAPLPDVRPDEVPERISPPVPEYLPGYPEQPNRSIHLSWVFILLLGIAIGFAVATLLG